MADNVTIPATGSGTATPVVATDDVGPGVHYQKVKLDLGGDGATDTLATDVAGKVPTTAQGTVDHDAIDSGRPNKIGGKASSGVPIAVASADRVNAYFDLNGRLVTLIDTSLPAGINNIGDVDVLTLPALVAGTANIGDVDIASPLGAGTEAAALRVTVATDSTGVLSVDDNGGILTVDGTVIVQGAVAHDAAESGNPLQIGGYAESSRPTTVADADAARAWLDTLGRQVVILGSAESARVANEYTIDQTDTSQITAPGINLRIVIWDIVVSAGSAGTVLLESGTTVREFGRISLAANGGWSYNSAKGYRLPVNTALSLTSTGVINPLSITVNYTIEQDLTVAGVA